MKKLVQQVTAQKTIGFELLLVEELHARGLVREAHMVHAIGFRLLGEPARQGPWRRCGAMGA
jgi:hypothetical protein